MAYPDIVEEWRRVQDWTDYEISSLGRLRRCVSLYQANPRGAGMIKRRPAGVLLKPFPDPDGYLIVNLVRDGMVRRRRVSMLVCRAFNGERPTPKHHAAHNDGSKTNNAATNLIWKTPKENNQDKIRHGTTTRGERHGSAILTATQVSEIRATRTRSGRTAKMMAAEFGVTKGSIDKARQGVTWKHI